MLQSFSYENRFTITILWIFYQPLQMPITKPWIKEIFNLQSSMHGIRSMLWKPQVIISTQFEHAFKRERPDVETQVNKSVYLLYCWLAGESEACGWRCPILSAESPWTTDTDTFTAWTFLPFHTVCENISSLLACELMPCQLL